eukprot:Gb_22279 [translate_table: standard]
MFLCLESIPTVVTSSLDLAKEFLKTHVVILLAPTNYVGKTMIYNSINMVFSPYGPYGKCMRCVYLLSAKRIESINFIIEEEIVIIHESIMKECCVNGSNPMNINKLVSTVRMDFGRKYLEEMLKDNMGFKAMI